MKQKKLGTVFFMIAGIVCMMTNLHALSTQQIIDSLEDSKLLHVEEVYGGEALRAISRATIYEATYGFFVSESVSSISLYKHFLQDGSTLTPFDTDFSLFSSEAFVNTIRDDFFLKDVNDGLLFQQFLYDVDDNYFNEGFFVEGNTWYFVRDEFFGDIEAWIVKTDDQGSILNISYEYEADIVLGDDLIQDMDLEYAYSDKEYAPPAESIVSQIEAIMEKEFAYEVAVSPITSQWLAKISRASWYSCEISISEEYDGMSSTSWYELLAFALEDDIHMFEEPAQLLTSPAFVASIQPGFLLTDDASAELFELALDQVSDFSRKEKARFERNGSWVFIRSEFFDDGIGFIVDTDDTGRITTITQHYDIPLEGVEVPLEIPFDESEVDWIFTLLEPSHKSIQIPQAETTYVTIEFNDWAANKLGAWIGTFWQGDLVGIYAGTEISSPFADSIPAEVLTDGENIITYKLLRPGHDYDNPLAEAIELSIWVGD